MKIGIFDSGKGGLLIFDEIKRVLPRAEYKYIADSENCPYGEKTDEELMKIVRGNVEELKKWGAKIIVIACNTATMRCITRLREEYPELVFVGTEPAIKLAADSGAKKILVMATPGTVGAEKTLKLVEDNKKRGQTIKLLACPGLADTIEFGQDIEEKLTDLLEGIELVDCVVLGCTHYSLIKDKIRNRFPKAKVIDGNRGVALKVMEVAEHKKSPL